MLLGLFQHRAVTYVTASSLYAGFKVGVRYMIIAGLFTCVLFFCIFTMFYVVFQLQLCLLPFIWAYYHVIKLQCAVSFVALFLSKWSHCKTSCLNWLERIVSWSEIFWFSFLAHHCQRSLGARTKVDTGIFLRLSVTIYIVSKFYLVLIYRSRWLFFRNWCRISSKVFRSCLWSLLFQPGPSRHVGWCYVGNAQVWVSLVFMMSIFTVFVVFFRKAK